MDNIIHFDSNINEMAMLYKKSYRKATMMSSKATILFSYIELLYPVIKYNIDKNKTNGKEQTYYVSFVKNAREFYNPKDSKQARKLSREICKIRDIKNKIQTAKGNMLLYEYAPFDMEIYKQIETDSGIFDAE